MKLVEKRNCLLLVLMDLSILFELVVVDQGGQGGGSEDKLRFQVDPLPKSRRPGISVRGLGIAIVSRRWMRD